MLRRVALLPKKISLPPRSWLLSLFEVSSTRQHRNLDFCLLHSRWVLADFQPSMKKESTLFHRSSHKKSPAASLSGEPWVKDTRKRFEEWNCIDPSDERRGTLPDLSKKARLLLEDRYCWPCSWLRYRCSWLNSHIFDQRTWFRQRCSSLFLSFESSWIAPWIHG